MSLSTKTKEHVRFNERVEVVMIQRPHYKNKNYGVWYNANDFARFREERRSEIKALKFRGSMATHLSCRGNEQIVFQASRQRILSRAMFIRKVLEQQDYENMKSNIDSRMEVRLAAKIRCWSMASVDQAIMRAQLDVEASNEDPIQLNQFPTGSLKSSTSFKVANDHTSPSILLFPKVCYCPKDMTKTLTRKPYIAAQKAQSFEEIICKARTTKFQGLTLVKEVQIANCA